VNSSVANCGGVAIAAWKNPDQPTDAEKIAYYDTFIA
jgi:hypothetical protein